jgi:hypothetical protein
MLLQRAWHDGWRYRLYFQPVKLQRIAAEHCFFVRPAQVFPFEQFIDLVSALDRVENLMGKITAE